MDPGFTQRLRKVLMKEYEYDIARNVKIIEAGRVGGAFKVVLTLGGHRSEYYFYSALDMRSVHESTSGSAELFQREQVGNTAARIIYLEYLSTQRM